MLCFDAQAIKLFGHNAGNALNAFSAKGVLPQHGREMHRIEKTAFCAC
jgi:hypothetical protein